MLSKSEMKRLGLIGKKILTNPETGEKFTVDYDDPDTFILTKEETIDRHTNLSNEKVFSRSDFDEDEEEDWIKYKERMGLK